MEKRKERASLGNRRAGKTDSAGPRKPEKEKEIMPAHGKPVNFNKLYPKRTGYLGSTTHRGTRLVSTSQKRLLMVRELPHTDVYRSKAGNIYRKRRFA